MNENETLDNEQNIDQTNTDTSSKSAREAELEAEVSKLSAIIKRRKEKEESNDSKEEETQPIINNQGNSQIERLELKVDGYPDHVIDSIIKNGGKKSLEDPIFKRVVNEMVQEHKNEIASNIDSGSKSDWEKKYTEKDLANMTVEELEKILPHA